MATSNTNPPLPPLPSSAVLAKARDVIPRNQEKAAEHAKVETFNAAARLIVITFCVSILGTMAFVGYCVIAGKEWTAGYNAILDLIKIALVPVTSTALGYYIGQARSRSR